MTERRIGGGREEERKEPLLLDQRGAAERLPEERRSETNKADWKVVTSVSWTALKA